MSPTTPTILAGRFLEFGTDALAKNDASVEGVVFWEKFSREGFVDDDNARSGTVIAVVERATFNERDTENVEVAGRDVDPNPRRRCTGLPWVVDLRC